MAATLRQCRSIRLACGCKRKKKGSGGMIFTSALPMLDALLISGLAQLRGDPASIWTPELCDALVRTEGQEEQEDRNVLVPTRPLLAHCAREIERWHRAGGYPYPAKPFELLSEREEQAQRRHQLMDKIERFVKSKVLCIFFFISFRFYKLGDRTLTISCGRWTCAIC